MAERTFKVLLDLNDIINTGDMDAFNDLVEQTAIEDGHLKESELMSDISYVPEGAHNGGVLVRVECDVVGIDEDYD